MIHFWVAVLAISTLLYVLLDGFDLGVGMIFGATPDEAKRDAMMSAIAPIWDQRICMMFSRRMMLPHQRRAEHPVRA